MNFVISKPKSCSSPFASGVACCQLNEFEWFYKVVSPKGAGRKCRFSVFSNFAILTYELVFDGKFYKPYNGFGFGLGEDIAAVCFYGSFADE